MPLNREKQKRVGNLNNSIDLNANLKLSNKDLTESLSLQLK